MGIICPINQERNKSGIGLKAANEGRMFVMFRKMDTQNLKRIIMFCAEEAINWFVGIHG